MSERISSMACPWNASTTVSMVALALRTTSADVPSLMSSLTAWSNALSMPAF